MRGKVSLTHLGLFVALVAVATMVINIPVPATQGFVNAGDTLIFVAGLLFGPVTGAIAGGLGSALADMLLGYAHWAPWTLIIKGVEGLLAGYLGHKWKNSWAATTIAAIWMIGGYFLASVVIYGVAGAIASVPGNILQGAVSLVLAQLLIVPLKGIFR